MRALSYRSALYLLALLATPGACKKGKHKAEGDRAGDADDDEQPSASQIPAPQETSRAITSSLPSPAPKMGNAAEAAEKSAPANSQPPSPTPSRSFQWTNPDNTTTCDSTTFLWSASGLFGNQMTLQVSNLNVPNHTASTPIPVLHNLTTNVAINIQVFAWLMVDVPEGWYTVNAIPNSPNKDFSAASAPFFVVNGTDTSCIKGQLFDGPPAPAQNASGTNPTPEATVAHKANIPVIIGTILGAVVAFVILSIAFIFPRFWRHALPTSKGRRVLYYY